MAELTNGVITAKQLGQVAGQIAETFAKKAELEALSQDLTGSFGSALDNVYTKNDVYTKTESENKFQPKGNYAESSSVTKTALESTLGMSSYAKSSDLSSYAKKAELEALSQDLTGSFGSALDNVYTKNDVYTKTESENKFQPKGSYASKSVEDEWNAFKAGADNTQNAIDTLKEIQTYINSDTNAFTTLSNTVNAIPSTYAKKSELKDGAYKTDADLTEYVNNAVANNYNIELLHTKTGQLETAVNDLNDALDEYEKIENLGDAAYTNFATTTDINTILNSIK